MQIVKNQKELVTIGQFQSGSSGSITYCKPQLMNVVTWEGLHPTHSACISGHMVGGEVKTVTINDTYYVARRSRADQEELVLELPSDVKLPRCPHCNEVVL